MRRGGRECVMMRWIDLLTIAACLLVIWSLLHPPGRGVPALMPAVQRMGDANTAGGVLKEKYTQAARPRAAGVERQCEVDIKVVDADDACAPETTSITCGRCLKAPGLPTECTSCRLILEDFVQPGMRSARPRERKAYGGASKADQWTPDPEE
jgi:hypothetical protein